MDTGISFGWLFVKTIAAMAVVIGLAFLLLRYVLPRFYGTVRSGGSRIKILERFGLEPRKGLYIVRVGNKQALIGTSDHSVNKLMDLEESDLKETK
ncbi:MAG: flagellar biosynthetic protein FliO [Deltaproteobacteria bacterium]|nr:flagellar biosynthetic protein FliO [Deltaproteobacteria bacterium]